MKKILIFTAAMIFVCSSAQISRASDWDKAGKILTGIEGLRILTGGKIDVVGTMIGAGQHVYDDVYHTNRHRHRYRSKHRKYARHYPRCKMHKVWVPHYEWERKHIPAHEEYDEEYGNIYVEEHYVKYKVETGGHWEKVKSCD